jgi:Ca2+-binding RTX toxin-like protein
MEQHTPARDGRAAMIGWTRAHGEYDPAIEAALVGGGKAALTGTPGDDVIKGTTDADYIDVSQGGDDVVRSKRGYDTIFFGAEFTSADRVYGAVGTDRLVLQGDYSAGVSLSGASIHDVEMIDLLAGYSYKLTGDMDFKNAFGFVYIDASVLGKDDELFLDGRDAREELSGAGGAGDDVVLGGDSFVTFLGHDGNDQLTAGEGGGRFFGGSGADVLSVEDGDVVCSYTFATESTRKAIDLILGFGTGDEFDLTSVDADATQAGNQAFHFGATPGRVGDLTVQYDQAQDLTIVRAYTDGDAKADMEIHLQGQVPLTPADFLL